jgi:pimeloyl-ACP methyl ester carboxylesterase
MYNNLADTVDSYVRFSETQMDAYSEVQYAWTFARKNRTPDLQFKGEQDPASLETLGSAFVRVKDPEFPNRGKTRNVLISSTGKRLKFTLWLQKKKAPVVYIVPGLGSHRLSDAVLALAESLYQKGYSAISVSSTFNYEFMLQASTASVPAYMPVDAHDLHVALTAIDSHLEMLFPRRFGPRALLGYSMGGFQTLFIAAREDRLDEGLLKFDRYVAINAPVRLLYGISKLDEFYDAPLAWPETQRGGDIENIFLKVAELTKSDRPQAQAPPPFSAVESKFLIGLAFRLILRDAIFTSQLRYNQGILQHQVGSLKRAPVYKEILEYSYEDYLERFLVPYYSSRGLDLTSSEALEKASNLRTYSTGLQACKRIRVITNRNDFLLSDDDLKWLQSIFSSEQLTIFEQGGHLGNLGSAEMQHAIGVALDGLGPVKR